MKTTFNIKIYSDGVNKTIIEVKSTNGPGYIFKVKTAWLLNIVARIAVNQQVDLNKATEILAREIPGNCSNNPQK